MSGQTFLLAFLAVKERVRVLERIATDKGAALAAEIDGLPPLANRRVEPPSQPCR